MTIKSKAFKFLLGIAVVLGVAVSASLASAADFGTATLRVGSRGAAVMEVQKVVGANPVDGIFGPMTMAAVKAWQANNGLTADGVVGNYTKAAMSGVSTVVVSGGVAGCPAGAVYNYLTGAACGTTTTTTPTTPSTPSTTLKGEAGDLTVTQTSKNVESTVKEGNEEKVIAFKVEADDSDIQLTNVKVELKNHANDTTSEKLTNYIDEVKVYLGSKEVASVDASDFSRESGSPDLFTKSISLKNVVVEDGKTDYLYVAVVAVEDIDSDDKTADWDITVDSVRFTDATGAIMTDSVNDSETFDFKLASEDDKLDIKSSSANPDDITVKVDDNDTTDDVLALAFKLDNDEDSSDMDLQTIEVTAQTNIAIATLDTVAEVKDIIDSVTLKIAGEEFDAEDIVIGDLDLTDTYTVVTYTFDIDGDVTIDAGDVEEAEVYVTFAEQTASTPNTTVEFAVSHLGIEAEADGDEVDSANDINGSQTGGVLTLSSTAANVSNVKWSVSNAGTFLDLFFTVEADDDDFEFLTSSVDDAKNAGTAAIVAGTTFISDAAGVVSKYSGDATAVAAADSATDFFTTDGFKVNEGDKATFRVRYSLGSNATTPVVTANNGMWLEVKVTSVAGQTVAGDLQTSPTATVSL